MGLASRTCSGGGSGGGSYLTEFWSLSGVAKLNVIMDGILGKAEKQRVHSEFHICITKCLNIGTRGKFHRKHGEHLSILYALKW